MNGLGPLQTAVRSTLPSTGLPWFPSRPGRVGTQSMGATMSTPGLGSTRDVEYKDEDYGTSANYAVVTMLNFTPCRELPCPVGADLAVNRAALERSRGFTQRPQSGEEGHLWGVDATKGELIFSYVRRGRVTMSRIEKMFPVVHASYDDTAEFTEGITLPWLNKYLALFTAGNAPVAFEWDVRALQQLANNLRFVGVVDSVGPGQTMMTDRVVKNYVVIMQRVASGVADIWSGLGRRPGGLLFLELSGLPVNGGARVGNFVPCTDLRVRPFAAMSYMTSQARIGQAIQYPEDPVGTLRHVLCQWFVGTYRSNTVYSTQARGVPAAAYITGDFAQQKNLAQCEIDVAE